MIPSRGTDDGCDQDRHEPDGHGDARTINDTAEQVPAEVVRAHRVRPAWSLEPLDPVYLVWVEGRDDRREDCQQRDDDDDDQADHARPVTGELARKLPESAGYGTDFSRDDDSGLEGDVGHSPPWPYLMRGSMYA